MRVSRTSEAMPFGPPQVSAPSASEAMPAMGHSPALPSEQQRPASVAVPFMQLLRSVGRELDRGENMTETAIRGGAHGGTSPARLIALQAGIYRYSEAVDLVTKLVDRGTQAVRTTLQNQ